MAEHARERELFADELVCVLRTPFAVRRHTEPVDAQRLAHRGVTLLRGAAMLESEHAPAHVGDENEPDWWRLESKIDLMLEMLGALHRRAGVAATQTLRCSRLGIACETERDMTPPVAGPSMAAIELHPLVPQPLEWPGETVIGEPVDGLTPLWFRFDPMPEALQSAWERHLFRHHRRTIAESRRRL